MGLQEGSCLNVFFKKFHFSGIKYSLFFSSLILITFFCFSCSSSFMFW